jgi:hypothetical protein
MKSPLSRQTLAAAFLLLSASQGGRVGVRCWRLTGDPEFKALERAIKVHWLK